MSNSGPLRVGLVVSAFPVVSESFVYELALSLRREGMRTEIVALHGQSAEDIADLGPLAHAREISRLAPPLDRRGAVMRALRRPLDLRVDLEQPRRWADTARQATLFEAAGPFDVIHAQFATLGLQTLRQIDLGALRTRALVVHLRGYDITRYVREHGRDVYAHLFARANLFVANCEHFRQVAIGLGCPPEKCIVIGSPCDTEYFTPPPDPREVPRERPVRLVAVGRLVEKKGFADAVDAVARLRAGGHEVTLDILGDGPDRVALAALITQAGLDSHVRLLGAASRGRVRDALHAADIGLAPSVTAASGDQDAPVNTLKEQMATALPVIATRHGGIPELVIDDVNGRLVPERAPDMLAEAIAELMGVPHRWPDMGSVGREKVVRDYGRQGILEKTCAAYGRALNFAKMTDLAGDNR